MAVYAEMVRRIKKPRPMLANFPPSVMGSNFEPPPRSEDMPSCVASTVVVTIPRPSNSPPGLCSMEPIKPEMTTTKNRIRNQSCHSKGANALRNFFAKDSVSTSYFETR